MISVDSVKSRDLYRSQHSAPKDLPKNIRMTPQKVSRLGMMIWVSIIWEIVVATWRLVVSARLWTLSGKGNYNRTLADGRLCRIPTMSERTLLGSKNQWSTTQDLLTYGFSGCDFVDARTICIINLYHLSCSECKCCEIVFEYLGRPPACAARGEKKYWHPALENASSYINEA